VTVFQPREAQLRGVAQACFQAAVRAADPYEAVAKALTPTAKGLRVEGRDTTYRRVHVLAFGKAALRMAQAACDTIEPSQRVDPVVVITNQENYQAFCREQAGDAFVRAIDVYQGGHPLPSARGQKGAEVVLERARGAREDELVLVLISGGGSALAPLPPTGVTLADKIKTTELLLHSGASIQQMNVVRKHLSAIKGGRLTQAASPAHVHALILSDVIGDDLATIASGPTVVDASTYEDAWQVLKSFALLSKVPPTVQRYLQEGVAGKHRESLKADDAAASLVTTTLVGSNRLSVEAVHKEAHRQGFAANIWRFDACGEARVLAEEMARMVKHEGKQKQAWLCGGETTVQVVGTGKGGRNQELAVAFAVSARTHDVQGDWVFLSGGTDGRDGPTDAAGGCVHSGSYQRWIDKTLKPEDVLANNDCYSLLKETGELVTIGATGTNVADVQIFLRD